MKVLATFSGFATKTVLKARKPVMNVTDKRRVLSG